MYQAILSGGQMRLGNKKIINIRKSRESKKKFLAFFILSGVIISVMLFVSYFLEAIRPMMIEVSKNEAKVLANDAINDAVISIFAENLSFEDIYTFEKNGNNDILAVKYNLEKVNLLKSKLSLKIQENIEKTKETRITLPLGTLLGTDILAGMGPKFSVEFMPYGIAQTEFLSEFSDSGINQTRLIINLSVKTSLGLIMPTAKAKIDISQTVPVVQTVIVGDVPESYTNIDREGYEYEGDVMDILN